ncbi:MAG TPA: dihydropteroate synthase [Acidimicrobiia bacterium]|nr:dihydropteroate synthase [Acidimicrobiia bacterium]
MGVVNVTPDSFSDGGAFLSVDAAIAHGRQLARDGAAVLDVGGESTRPGAAPVDADEELRRVVPVVRALAAEPGVYVSIDTTKARVAEAAIESGASIVNDVSGGRADAAMHDVIASTGAGYVAMHMRGTPRTMQREATYHDVVADVGRELRDRVDAALAVGVRADGLMADPGIGFAKTADQNVELLRALPELARYAGVPLLVGASRKSFLGALLGDLPVGERDEATLATTVWCFTTGAAMVRVHDVESSVRAAQLMDVMERATATGMVAA